jgi:hypothetical protein
MAKKQAKKSPPAWISKLTQKQLDRLESLRPIADDPDTCEMPNITLTRVRRGAGKGLWLAGNVEKPPTRRPAKKRR